MNEKQEKIRFQKFNIILRTIKAVAEPWFEDSLKNIPDTPENLKHKEKLRMLFGISVEQETKKCLKEIESYE